MAKWPQEECWSRKNISKITEPHIKKIHQSGVLNIRHTDPFEILGAKTPQSLTDQFRQVREVFGKYVASLLDEAAKLDKIESLIITNGKRKIDYK